VRGVERGEGCVSVDIHEVPAVPLDRIDQEGGLPLERDRIPIAKAQQMSG